MKFAPRGPFVERLDVLEPMLEAVSTQVDLVFRHRVKHECIVGVRRMSERKDASFGRHGRMLSALFDARNYRCRLRS
jgi:hypothetical protein